MALSMGPNARKKGRGVFSVRGLKEKGEFRELKEKGRRFLKKEKKTFSTSGIYTIREKRRDGKWPDGAEKRKRSFHKKQGRRGRGRAAIPKSEENVRRTSRTITSTGQKREGRLYGGW